MSGEKQMTSHVDSPAISLDNYSESVVTIHRNESDNTGVSTRKRFVIEYEHE